MPVSPPLRITKLAITAVRGIPELELNLDAKGLLLCGPNGTGKSSIVDACEFLLLGSIGHLEGKQTLSLSKHGKNVQAEGKAMRVESTLTHNNNLSRTLGSSPSCTPDAEPYLRSAQRHAFLLRRAQLLAFIHADPADRFRALAGLIGIDQLDQLELTFMRVRDALEGEVRDLLSQLATRQAELERLTGLTSDKLDKASLLMTVNALLTAVGRAPITDLGNVDELSAALAATGGAERAAREVVSTEQAIAGIEELNADGKIFRAAAELVQRIQAFVIDQGSRQALASRDVLASSERYLITYSPEQCPVCDQPIDAPSVAGRLTEKLQTLRELSESASALRVEASSLAAQLEGVTQRYSVMKSKHGSILGGEVLRTVTAAESKATALAQGFRRDRLLSEPYSWPGTNAEEDNLFSWTLSRSREDLEQRLQGLRPSDQAKRLADTITKVMRIQQTFAETTNAAKLLVRRNRHSDRAKVATEAIVSAKNEVVTDIFNSIKASVDRFYEVILPQGDHKNVTLDIVRRASADLRIKSFGRGKEDPRAFSSEAHLDTLGLCIFLAFAKAFSGDCSLLILDDVVMSIDQGHRFRIARLLMSEFDEFQMMVTTHDRIWFKELLASQKMFGRSADFTGVEITNWSLADGPTLSDYKPAWIQVDEKLIAGDLTGAGSGTRRNLEWVLQEIAERAQVPIPFQREPRYTVEVLYTPVRQRLDKLVPHELGAPPNVLSRLEASRIFANMLTHATVEGDAVAKEEVEEFAKAVKGLHDWFCCRTCGVLLWYDQQGKLMLCRNPKCAAPTIWRCR
jgi:energy-coupling factor transporter ATP-binding protein EcfA2